MCCFAVKNAHLQRSYGCSTLFCFVLLCCQEWSFAKKLHTWRYHASIELVLTTMNDFSSCLINTPVNMLDPIRKRFGYSQLWQLQPACSHNWARSYMPDLTSCILFSSVFLKKAWAILCQTNLDLIWMAWPGFSNTDLVWKQAGVQESSGLVSDRRQPACY